MYIIISYTGYNFRANTARIPALTYTYIRIYGYTYIHPPTHTHIHTHKHTPTYKKNILTKNPKKSQGKKEKEGKTPREKRNRDPRCHSLLTGVSLFFRGLYKTKKKGEKGTRDFDRPKVPFGAKIRGRHVVIYAR